MTDDPKPTLFRPLIDREQLGRLRAAGLTPTEVLGFLVWLTSCRPEFLPKVKGQPLQLSETRGQNSTGFSVVARRTGIERHTIGRAVEKARKAGLIRMLRPRDRERRLAALYDCSVILGYRGNGASWEEQALRTKRVAPDLRRFVDQVTALAGLLGTGAVSSKARTSYTKALREVPEAERPLLLSVLQTRILKARAEDDEAFDAASFCRNWDAERSKPAPRKADTHRDPSKSAGGAEQIQNAADFQTTQWRIETLLKERIKKGPHPLKEGAVTRLVNEMVTPENVATGLDVKIAAGAIYERYAGEWV